jgi:hypothetical protein
MTSFCGVRVFCSYTDLIPLQLIVLIISALFQFPWHRSLKWWYSKILFTDKFSTLCTTLLIKSMGYSAGYGITCVCETWRLRVH